jgi:hypothetical protein
LCCAGVQWGRRPPEERVTGITRTRRMRPSRRSCQYSLSALLHLSLAIPFGECAIMKTRVALWGLLAVFCSLGTCVAAEPLWSDDFQTLDNWDQSPLALVADRASPPAPYWTVNNRWLQPTKERDPKVTECFLDFALAKATVPADCTIRCAVRRRSKCGVIGVVRRDFRHLHVARR